MDTYNVKQVAKILNTSEETVRRWIRSGKLKANMDSRKQGSVITEKMLNEFVKTTPKYVATLTTPVGEIVAASMLLLGTIIGKSIEKKEAIKASSIDAEQVEKILKSNLTSAGSNIKNKRNAIAQLEKEIKEEEIKIKSIEYLLKNIKNKNILEQNGVGEEEQ